MKLVLPSSNILTDRSKAVLLLWIFLFYVCLCYIVLSVSCSLVVTFWERVDFLALLYVIFSCVYVTFPYGILGQVCYFIVSVPELCVHHYFVM